MPLIIPTNSISDLGYNVDNSLRFNPSSSDGLTRTTGTPTSRRKFTFSSWVKKADIDISDNQALFSVTDNSTNQLDIRFQHTNEQIEIIDYQGSTQMFLRTSKVFRDPSAWYHIVVTVNTTNATANDRIKFFVNGLEETSFASRTNPSLNHDTAVNQTNTRVGWQNSQYYFDGYLAETVFIDGQALDPTSFGEFDEDSGIWKPIDVSGLTFGTNGFYLPFENSADLGQDDSGNGNDFTVNNLTSIDQSTDTCTNNFITLDPLEVNESTGRTLSEGNLTYTSDSSNASSARGTFGVNSGKWYYEVKIVSQSGAASGSNGKFGTFGFTNIAEQSSPAENGLTIISDGRLRGQGSTGSVIGSPPLWGVGDILMFALDMDNQNLYMGKNGSWRTSAGAFSDSSPTDTIFTSIDTSKFWTPFGQKNVSVDNTLSYSMNFGSPAFTISSGNSDANGYGNFEYSVPSGYYALNTKNLAEYG